MSVTVAIGSTVTTKIPRVAVATTGNGSVDRHFGQVTEFSIYEVDGQRVQSIERRSIPQYCHGNNGEAGDLSEIIFLLSDCTAIAVAKIGENPEGRLRDAGFEVVSGDGAIETALLSFYDQWIAKRE